MTTRGEMEKLRREYSATMRLRQRSLKIAGDTPATPVETSDPVKAGNSASLSPGQTSGRYSTRPSTTTRSTAQRESFSSTTDLTPIKYLLALLVRSWPTEDLETRAVTPSAGERRPDANEHLALGVPNERGRFPWRGYAERWRR